jgi:uncharacterized membrane protein (DUF106 family)
MYYVKKIIQIVLLGALIWIGVENFNSKVESIHLFNYPVVENTSVIFVIFASIVIGWFMSSFFAAIKEWSTVRLHKKTVNELKSTIKDLELRSKDLQIAQNEVEKLKIESNSLKSEVKTLKDVIGTFPGTAANKQVEY